MICISGICLAPRKEIPMPVAMNMLYEYTDRPAQQALELDADHWNFKEHPVDYVVINLGTNDATAASFQPRPRKLRSSMRRIMFTFEDCPQMQWRQNENHLCSGQYGLLLL